MKEEKFDFEAFSADRDAGYIRLYICKCPIGNHHRKHHRHHRHHQMTAHRH